MSEVKSDIQIAREAKMQPIKDILAKINVPDESSAFSPMGGHIAKINLEYLDSLKSKKEGKLILDSNVEVNINNSNELYKFLVTPKNLRKKISKVNVNFTYLFDEKNININDIRIDGKTLEKSKYTFDDILLKENNLQNKIYFKNLLNEVIKSYSG